MYIFWVWINWRPSPKRNFHFRVNLQVRTLLWVQLDCGWRVLCCHGEFVVDCELCCTKCWKSSIPVEVFCVLTDTERLRLCRLAGARLSRQTRIGSTRPGRSLVGSWRRVPPPEGASLSQGECRSRRCRVPDTRRYFLFIYFLTATLTRPTKQSTLAKQ